MDQSRVNALVPGRLHTPSLPLARYRQSWISDAIKLFITGLNKPGATVLVLGNGHGHYVQELLEARCRCIILNPNPLPLLWMHCELNSVPIEDIQRALTFIAHSEKSGLRLSQYIHEAYSTECPVCHHPAQARWFAWDRDANRLIERYIECPHCNVSGRYTITQKDDDRSRAYGHHARPAFFWALERIAPQGSEFREYANELLNLYTPRNLAVLTAIIRQYPHCSDNPDVKRVIASLLLEALDRGSKLNPVDESGSRPRSLRPANVYYEYHIWDMIAQAMQLYEDTHKDISTFADLSGNLPQLLERHEPSYVWLAHPVDFLSNHLAHDSVDAVIWQLDAPDAVFTNLSALWAAWLWGSNSIKSMTKLISRRRHDLPWYESLLQLQASILPAILKNDADIMLFSPSTKADVLAAGIRAVESTGFSLGRWIATGSGASYLHYSNGEDKQIVNLDKLDFVQYTITALTTRQQPVTPSLLEAGYAITQPNAAAPDWKALNLTPQLSVSEKYIWMTKPEKVKDDQPLYDQVEQLVVTLLKQRESWSYSTLLRMIYARFNGLHSLELSFVETCIEAYAVERQPGIAQLREEDRASSREADIVQSRHMLHDLGVRLQYTVFSAPNGDYIWQDMGFCRYRFRIITSAIITPHLLGKEPECEGKRCLVFPGGRAGLIAAKLAIDPRLSGIVLGGQWTFIKFRHLRRMAHDITDRPEVEVYLGLDPIAEQSRAQIPLLLN